MSSFYVVATPIGNLEDITLRALRMLKEVDLILCEDTRVTRKLLRKYEIGTPLESYHSHSKLKKSDKILKLLSDGKDIALVSDAGTPTISDPGLKLLKLIREKNMDVDIFTVPGPSALTAALSASGLPASEFMFLGFLPHKKGRRTLFKEISDSKRTTVFYESPHRLLKTLSVLKEAMDDDREVVVMREMTKIYEERVSGSPAEVLEIFEKNPEKVRGEIVLLVSGK